MSNSTGALLRRLAPSIYGPTMLFTLGEYAVVPLIPVIAIEMGADLGFSGLIASALVVGQLAGNLPASWVVARVGERVAMLLATCVALVAVLGIAFAPNLAVLTASVFVVGVAAAVIALARHAFMATRVPFGFRARALSLIGGSLRLGRFAGPFVAAGLVAATGRPEAPVWAFGGCLVLTALLVGFAPDPERVAVAAGAPVGASTSAPVDPGVAARVAAANDGGGILAAVRAGRAPLLRIGGCAAILSGLRAVKDVLLPLWGIAIGMDPAAVALVVGVSGTIDFALFYASGQVMDRYGRLWAALPATIAMALSFLTLSATRELPGAEAWLVACAAVMGVGNGLSSGVLLTLGADLAPPHNPAPFLAAWRTVSDLGGATAPLLASTIAIASLPLASAVTGALAVLGSVGFARWIPRYIRREPDER